jgi:hypothetical protein
MTPPSPPPKRPRDAPQSRRTTFIWVAPFTSCEACVLVRVRIPVAGCESSRSARVMWGLSCGPLCSEPTRESLTPSRAVSGSLRFGVGRFRRESTRKSSQGGREVRGRDCLLARRYARIPPPQATKPSRCSRPPCESPIGRVRWRLLRISGAPARIALLVRVQLPVGLNCVHLAAGVHVESARNLRVG